MSPPERREIERETYREVGQLAEGGMAIVLRAVRERDGADVVIKRVRPPLCFDAGYLGLFRDEGALHAQLKHEHIVQLLDRGDDEQGPYLVFEHVSGTDLGALLQRAIEEGRPLDLELVLAVAVPIADALAFVHDASCDGHSLGAIHRDVSPANVLLGEDGDVKLADFGVAASRLKTEVTVAGELKGKFAYMAPEQTRGGPVTTSADLFALGVVLWECLANRRLFEAPTDVDIVQQVRHAEAPRLDTLSLARPVDTVVADNPRTIASSTTSSNEARRSAGVNWRGLEKSAQPMSIVTAPKSLATVNVRGPASVSTTTSCSVGMRPVSARWRATQRRPLPHISGTEPSGFVMCMR